MKKTTKTNQKKNYDEYGDRRELIALAYIINANFQYLNDLLFGLNNFQDMMNHRKELQYLPTEIKFASCLLNVSVLGKSYDRDENPNSILKDGLWFYDESAFQEFGETARITDRLWKSQIKNTDDKLEKALKIIQKQKNYHTEFLNNVKFKKGLSDLIELDVSDDNAFQVIQDFLINIICIYYICLGKVTKGKFKGLTTTRKEFDYIEKDKILGDQTFNTFKDKTYLLYYFILNNLKELIANRVCEYLGYQKKDMEIKTTNAVNINSRRMQKEYKYDRIREILDKHNYVVDRNVRKLICDSTNNDAWDTNRDKVKEIAKREGKEVTFKRG